MKLTGKLSSLVLALGVLCGICAIPVVVLGISGMFKAHRAQEQFLTSELMMIVSLGALLIAFLITVLILIIVIRRVVLPVSVAARYADRMASGEVLPHLPVDANKDDEIHTLFTALNYLRDRQQSLTGKLKLSLSREADARRGIEAHHKLQLKIMTRMLPEMRIPLGSIKGFSRVLLLILDSEEPDKAEMERLLEEIGHRVATISRQIERLLDVAELDRERWSRFQNADIDTAEFMRELVAFNQISLEEREVKLVNHFSASAPAVIRLDRELLLQLMVLLIRAIGRSASPGETVVLSCFKEEGRVVFEVRDSRNKPFREAIADAYNSLERNFENQEETADLMAMDHASIPVLALLFARDLARKLSGELRVYSSESAHTVIRLEFAARILDAEGVPDPRRTHSMLGLGQGLKKQETAAIGVAPGPASDRVIQALHGSEVEDGPVLLQRLLGAEKIEVHSFRSADELREEAARAKYDCLIVSTSLKNADMPELIQELRETMKRPNLPVVVISSHFPDDLRRRLNALDRVFLMNVPLNYALLAKVLREASEAGGV